MMFSKTLRQAFLLSTVTLAACHPAGHETAAPVAGVASREAALPIPEGISAEVADALKEGNYQRAFTATKADAEAGNVQSMKLLGGMYYDGMGTAKNAKQSVKWWEKAAKKGDAAAQTQMGLLKLQEKREKEARKWLKKAAAQGNEQAIYALKSLDAGKKSSKRSS